MAPSSRLTGLTHFSAIVPPRHCLSNLAQGLSTLSMILARCTQLCEVVLTGCGAEDWMSLLPLLAGLSHLRLLGTPPLHDQLVAAVVSMTQLTHVRGTDYGTGGMHLQPLLKLTALRALGLSVNTDRSLPAVLRAATQGMEQLERFEIRLEGVPLDRSNMRSLLAPMSRLTKLDVLAWGRPLPLQDVWQSCLANLQDFRWYYADVIGGGVALPLSLRHLELTLAKWDSPEMPRMIRGIAAVTRLTALTLASEIAPTYGWTTDSRANATWRAAGFLTGLTRLIQLELNHFLHVGNVEGDVECLAFLTGLRSLLLWGSCACHGGEEVVYGREETGGWRVGACGFEDFEDRGGFLRLLSLAGGMELRVDGPWEVLKESRFRARFDSVRRVAG